MERLKEERLPQWADVARGQPRLGKRQTGSPTSVTSAPAVGQQDVRFWGILRFRFKGLDPRVQNPSGELTPWPID
jgi:hypothetical protein